MQPLQLSRSSRHRVGRRKQKLKMKLLFKFIFLLVLIQVARSDGTDENPCKDKHTAIKKDQALQERCKKVEEYKVCLKGQNKTETELMSLMDPLCKSDNDLNVTACAACKNETKAEPTKTTVKTTQAKNGKSSTASPKGATTTKKKETEHKEDGEGAAPGRELPVALIGAAALVAVALRPLLD